MTLSLAILTGISLLLAHADQQAPSQHAPAFEKYDEISSDESPTKNEERLTSSVTISWKAIPLAATYLVKVSRDPDMASLFYTVNTVHTAHNTPELAPGAYYFVVVGAKEDGRVVGQTAPEPFVVGKPMQLNGKRERLPAPTIIGPKHMDLYPTFGYVRVAWAPVEGARGYRFRLWNEDKVRENQRWKRDTPPRWITEVKNPWLEIHDAPYTSYMYLETGQYRWDIAAIDENGGFIGETAVGFFQTSRQWFLKTHEIFLRAGYGFEPNMLYESTSATSGKRFNFNSSSHRLLADADWWFFRQWGVGFTGGFASLNAHDASGKPSDTLMFINGSVNALFRTHLSTVPWGWTFQLNAGFAMQEFPEIDVFDKASGSIHSNRPKELGARLGFKFTKKWQSPWEMQLGANWLLHAYTTTAPTGATKTGTPLDMDVSARLLYNWTYHFATSVGLGAEYVRAEYTPAPAIAQSNVVMRGINITLGVQFNYYPPPDNEAYYPEHQSSYYPSERPESYYRSEKNGHQNMDEYHRDNSSWQRWRTR